MRQQHFHFCCSAAYSTQLFFYGIETSHSWYTSTYFYHGTKLNENTRIINLCWSLNTGLREESTIYPWSKEASWKLGLKFRAAPLSYPCFYRYVTVFLVGLRTYLREATCTGKLLSEVRFSEVNEKPSEHGSARVAKNARAPQPSDDEESSDGYQAKQVK
jgi:hypothetical protein